MGNNPILNDPFIKDIDQTFTEFLHEMPDDFREYLNEEVFSEEKIFFTKKLSLELIIDTNIMYQQVYAVMAKGVEESFFSKLNKNPYLKVFAPKQILIELPKKIRKKFPKNKATKHLDIEKCVEYGIELLSSIEIKDSEKEESLSRANTILSDRDPKDVDFLALSFDLRSHGIITADKDFEDQENVKTWKLRDVGSVITELNKGSISFVLLCKTGNGALKVFGGIISAIWNSFISTINGIISFATSVISKIYDSFSKIPKEIKNFGKVAIILSLFVPKWRKKIGDFIMFFWETIVDILKQVKALLSVLWKIIINLFEILKPVFIGIGKIIIYMTDQYMSAIKELNKLEKIRAV